MPRWVPQPIWEGRTVYVVGGGDSLRSFDWELIRGKPAIGCNSAFVLGAQVVPVVCFGDARWWTEIGREGTQEYGGLVVGSQPRLPRMDEPWLSWIPRHNKQGLAPKGSDSIGWNGNTGALALNLALLMGASKVCLLGFDMHMKSGTPNFHDRRYEVGRPNVYPRFVKQFKVVGKSLAEHYPGVEVVNVNDDSNLDQFPKVSIDEHFGLKVTA